MSKTLLITGATSGIGKYLAHYFSEQDMKLILHGRDSKKLKNLQQELKNPNASTVQANLSSHKEIETMFKTITQSYKSIDILINNAFGKLEDTIMDAKAEDIYEFFAVSLSGTAEIVRQSIPLLKKSKSGRIINIVADWGFPMHNIMTGPSLYIAAKYGVHGFGAALQTEISSLKIKTTNIFPGIVASDIEYGNNKNDYEKKYGEKAIHPMDIVKTIEYVLNQEHSHIRSIVLSPANPDYNGL